jgi:hypothetical protein
MRKSYKAILAIPITLPVSPFAVQYRNLPVFGVDVFPFEPAHFFYAQPNHAGHETADSYFWVVDTIKKPDELRLGEGKPNLVAMPDFHHLSISVFSDDMPDFFHHQQSFLA